MYIKDGIAYADDPTPMIEVTAVKPLDNFKLWIRFSTGETKIFDFKPLLNTPCFIPLKDKNVFNDVAVGAYTGTTEWLNGKIDIAPETLYCDGIVTR